MKVKWIENWFWHIKRRDISQSYGITAHWDADYLQYCSVVLSEGIVEPSQSSLKEFALSIQQDIFNKWMFPQGDPTHLLQNLRTVYGMETWSHLIRIKPQECKQIIQENEEGTFSSLWV